MEKNDLHRFSGTPFHTIRIKDLLIRITQPVTATQAVGKKHRLAKHFTYLFCKLESRGMVRCLNTKANQSRLYWLTEAGKKQQRMLRKKRGLPPVKHDYPPIDWQLYGSVCYSQRTSVIKTLCEAMQPAKIKRKALFNDPKLRMSANNVRDVIHFCLEHGIVRSVKQKRKVHLLYELTELGQHFQRLLLQAEVGL